MTADLLAALGALADELTAHNPGHGDFLAAGARLREIIAAHQPVEPEDIAAKVERSSLGTPEAQALRATVSDEQAARVVARAREMEAHQSERTDTAEACICGETHCRRCGLSKGAAIAGVLCDPPYAGSHDFAQPSEPERGER